jgi:hypothetical protein
MAGDRLLSALEVERGGTHVSEGVSEDWAAVAWAISERVRELGWRQRELAERSHVSLAVVREIQRHTVERRRSRRTLESLSVALGWEPERLDAVLKGRARQVTGNSPVIDSAALWSRLDALEERLDEVAKLVVGIRDDMAIVIDHVRRDA